MPREAPRNPSEADIRLDALVQGAVAAKRVRLSPDGRNAAEVRSFMNGVADELSRGLFDLSDENLQRVINLGVPNNDTARLEAIILSPIKQRYPDAKIEARQYGQAGEWDIMYSQDGRQVRRPIYDVLQECR